MRIFRATNTAVIQYVKDKIRPADGVSQEQYVTNLEAWLVNARDTIFLPVAFEANGDGLDVLQGFLVAYLPPMVDFIFVSQVWALTPRMAGLLMLRALEWGDSCGRTQARMESESDHDEYADKWGFKPITTTKAFNFTDVGPEWLAAVTTEPKPISDNGAAEKPDIVAGESVDYRPEPVLPRPDAQAADQSISKAVAKTE